MPRGVKPKPKPQANPTTPRPPRGMCSEATKEYKRIVAILEPHRILTDADLQALAIYATSVAQYWRAEEDINANGLVIETNGRAVKNPAITVQTQCWERIRPLIAEFGMTPSARARLAIGAAEDDSDDGFDF